MPRKIAFAAISLLLVVAALWWFRSPARRDTAPPAASTPTSQLPADLNLPIADPAAYADLHSPRVSPRDDLRIVEGLIQNFLSSLKPADVAPPMGFNEEITRALTGRNPLNVAFLPGNHPSIDAQGRICDRWGTPYFFHPQSALVIDLRSAGPDKKLFTDDDVTFSAVPE